MAQECYKTTLYALDGSYWCVKNVGRDTAERIIRSLCAIEKKTADTFKADLSRITPFWHKTILLDEENVVKETKEVKVSFELSYPIKKIAVLRKADNDHDEKILIERRNGEEALISLKKNQYRLGASFDSEAVGVIPSSLAVSILSESKPGHLLIDKCTCWIYMGDPGRVSFNLVDIDQHLAQGKISGMLEKVRGRVDEIFHGLFESKESIKA